MAVKISELPAASTLDGSELLEIVQTGSSKQTTAQDIADLGGGGSTPGIDDVLAVGQAGTADRTIDYTGFNLTTTANTHTFNVPVPGGLFSVIGNGSNYLSFLPRGGFSASIADPTGDIKSALVFGIDETSSNFELQLYFDDNRAVYVKGHAESGLATLESWADEHEWYVGGDEVFVIEAAGSTFNGNVGIGDSPTRLFEVSGTAGTAMYINENTFESAIQGNDGSATSTLYTAGDLAGNNVKFILSSNDAINNVAITGNAQTDAISYDASQHIFTGKVVLTLQAFLNNAAAISGGLTTGMLYYTNTAGDGIVKIVL